MAYVPKYNYGGNKSEKELDALSARLAEKFFEGTYYPKKSERFGSQYEIGPKLYFGIVDLFSRVRRFARIKPSPKAALFLSGAKAEYYRKTGYNYKELLEEVRTIYNDALNRSKGDRSYRKPLQEGNASNSYALTPKRPKPLPDALWYVLAFVVGWLLYRRH